jgi:hypothetical protein
MWLEEHERVPLISFLDEATIRIEDVRDFTWKDKHATPGWITRTITSEDLVRAHLIVEQFRSWGASHVFICFETGLDPICISIEARRKKGQSYSMVKGLFGAFELFYEYGSARDLIGKRLDKGHDLDVCELILSDEERWELFASLARSAQRNAREPQRYHTLKRNCATELMRHLPGSPKAPLLPKHTGPLLVSIGRAHPIDIFDAEHPPPFLRNP